MFTICGCHSWEIALNGSLEASFGNMYDQKGMREKTGELSITIAVLT